MTKGKHMITVSKAISRLGFYVLVGMLFLLLALIGFALSASGWGWVAGAGIVAFLAWGLWMTLRD